MVRGLIFPTNNLFRFFPSRIVTGIQSNQHPHMLGRHPQILNQPPPHFESPSASSNTSAANASRPVRPRLSCWLVSLFPGRRASAFHWMTPLHQHLPFFSFLLASFPPLSATTHFLSHSVFSIHLSLILTILTALTAQSYSWRLIPLIPPACDLLSI